jgi:thiol-disulfide isomerase/thioredoxin
MNRSLIISNWQNNKFKCLFVFAVFLVLMSSNTQKQSNSEIDLNVANDSNAYILYLFTGSDWCPNCKRFEKKVLNDSVFVSNISKHNIQIETLDFPQRKKLPPHRAKYNDSMAQVLHFDGGFPGIILQSSTSLATQKLSYSNETSKDFLTLLLESKAKLE